MVELNSLKQVEEVTFLMSVSEMKSILGEVFDWIKTFMIILIAVTIVHRFIFTPVKVDGASMYPTLHDEDTVILW